MHFAYCNIMKRYFPSDFHTFNDKQHFVVCITALNACSNNKYKNFTSDERRALQMIFTSLILIRVIKNVCLVNIIWSELKN